MNDIQSNYPRKFMPPIPRTPKLPEPGRALKLYNDLIKLQMSALIYVPFAISLIYGLSIHFRYLSAAVWFGYDPGLWFFGIYCLTLPLSFVAVIIFLNSDNQDDVLIPVGLGLQWHTNFLLAYWIFIPILLIPIHLWSFRKLRRAGLKVSFFALNRKAIMAQILEMARAEQKLLF